MMIEYPPPALDGESRLEWERRALNPWRQEMKRQYVARYGPMCARGCGRRGIDWDESVLPRCNMRGLSLDQRRFAFASCNGELACARCNRESAHDQEGAWARAVERFGLEVMQAWYLGIGLKVPDRRFLP